MNLISNQSTTIKILESVFDISYKGANSAYKIFKRNCWDGIDLDKINILEFDNIESVFKYFNEEIPNVITVHDFNNLCDKYSCYIDYDNTFALVVFLTRK